jgi:hypothetical protein
MNLSSIILITAIFGIIALFQVAINYISKKLIIYLKTKYKKRFADE